jgi:hypothetical protein
MTQLLDSTKYYAMVGIERTLLTTTKVGSKNKIVCK